MHNGKHGFRSRFLRMMAVLFFCVALVSSTNENPAFAVTMADQSQETSGAIDGISIRMGETEPYPEGHGLSYPLNSNDKIVAENKNFALYLDQTRMVIKIQDKANSFVWSSGVDSEQAAEFTPQWQAFSQSLLVAEYMSEAAPTTAVMEPSYQTVGPSEPVQFLENGIRTTLKFEQAGFQVDMIITLTEEGICVEIPDENICAIPSQNVEKKFVLSKLYVLPFLGARESAPNANGYIMIPDGGGALIHFGEASKYSMSFNGRVYGGDLGVVKETATLGTTPRVPSQKIQYPVFGIANGVGNNAFLTIVDQGDAYTEIVANPAGVKVDYFWACPKMVYREAYFQSTGKGNGFSSIQKERNPVDAKIYYQFLNGSAANYVGMAKSYQAYLENRGLLHRKEAVQEHIPFLAEAIMSELENGFFGYGVKKMTALADIGRWAGELEQAGIPNLIFSLKGFEKGGYSGGKINSYKVERKIGNERELEMLYDEIISKDGKLLLSKNFACGYEVQIPKKDLCYRIDHMLVSSQEQKAIFDKRLYTRASRVQELCLEIQDLPPYKQNLYLEDVGNTLVSDYHRNMERNRSQNLEIICRGLEAAAAESEYLILDTPNAYALPYADAIANMPIENSKYLYETAAVPFVPIVLSGYLPQFSQPLNFGTQTVADVLKLIDYNIYPAYIFTEKESSEFQNTNTNDVYSSCFADLKEYAVSNYQLLDQTLSKVQGQRVVSREIPQKGVSAVLYENGIYVVVNYTENDIQWNGVDVKAYSAAAASQAYCS